MIIINYSNGKQHNIPVNIIKSVKIEFNEHTGVGVFITLNNGSVTLVKTPNFSPSNSVVNSCIDTNEAYDVLNQILKKNIL